MWSFVQRCAAVTIAIESLLRTGRFSLDHGGKSATNSPPHDLSADTDCLRSIVRIARRLNRNRHSKLILVLRARQRLNDLRLTLQLERERDALVDI
jgi:hypothetical protein